MVATERRDNAALSASPDKTAFVTGGAGFVGRQLIADLIARGWQVRALVRSPASAEVVRRRGAVPVMGDLADTAAMTDGMRGCGVVFHAAAKVALWGDWKDFERDTVQGTANVIEAARGAGVPTLVHVGTEAVLADGGPIIDADETRPIPAHPNGPYPRSKALAEQMVRAANGSELRTVVVRPRFIWGEGDTSLLPRLAAAMKAGTWIWFGDRHHRMSTCHVANVSHGMILAAERGQGGEVYFLTDGEPVDFAAFITRMVGTQGVTPPRWGAPLSVAEGIAAAAEAAWSVVGSLTGTEPPLTRTAVNLFFREVTVRDAKARRELGYAPVITIEEGMQGLTRTGAIPAGAGSEAMSAG
jgi:nucleoside-diphosphate-sugar epimerase